MGRLKAIFNHRLIHVMETVLVFANAAHELAKRVLFDHSLSNRSEEKLLHAPDGPPNRIVRQTLGPILRIATVYRAMRMVFQLVGGRQLWRGKGVDREYLLAKLQTFHQKHQTPISQSVAELSEALQWLPKSSYAAEAKPLAELVRKKRRGPKSLGDLLVPLLARLGVSDPDTVESETSEARSSR